VSGTDPDYNFACSIEVLNPNTDVLQLTVEDAAPTHFGRCARPYPRSPPARRPRASAAIAARHGPAPAWRQAALGALRQPGGCSGPRPCARPPREPRAPRGCFTTCAAARCPPPTHSATSPGAQQTARTAR